MSTDQQKRFFFVMTMFSLNKLAVHSITTRGEKRQNTHTAISTFKIHVQDQKNKEKYSDSSIQNYSNMKNHKLIY